jgi:hypothetical protein
MDGYMDSMDNDSMDSGSMVDTAGMVGRLDRLDKWGKTGIEKVGVVFYDVFHNCRIQSHHRIDQNQIVSIIFSSF